MTLIISCGSNSLFLHRPLSVKQARTPESFRFSDHSSPFRSDRLSDDRKSADNSSNKRRSSESSSELNQNKLRKIERPSEADTTKHVESFESLCLSGGLLKALDSAKIRRPNALQSVIMPELLKRPVEGKPNADVFVKSTPSSGKKTAFLISALQRIDPDLKKTQVSSRFCSATLIGETIFILNLFICRCSSFHRPPNWCTTQRRWPKIWQSLQRSPLVTPLERTNRADR